MAEVTPFRFPYVRSHWVGGQSLKWSFWVNLVALRVAILLGQYALTTYSPATLSSYPVVALGLGIFFHGAVFIWQVVGVLRAGESHIRSMGSISDLWGAQLGILVAVWVVISESWGLWLAIHPSPPDEGYALHLGQGYEGHFSLTLSGDGKSADFTGDITRGSTKAVTAFLMENPDITRIILTSNGGNIFEARGLARLAREGNLNTYVPKYCSSACTLAFIGGAQRRLGQDAKLGFHQYRVDATYEVPFANPKAEQAKDRALFEQAGVAEWFLDRMFMTEPGDMWFPSPDDVRDAGVVTAE